MKKFLLTFLCCLLAAIGLQAEEATATLSFANSAQRTSFSTTQQVWEQNGIRFIHDKGTGNNIVNNTNPIRCYANSGITVEFTQPMTKIEFTCGSSSYATALKNSISTGPTVTISGSVVTIQLSTPATTFTISKLSAQSRLNSLTVYYEVNSELVDPEISWTGESSYSVVLGEAFDAPTLNNPNTLPVTYESSNTSVATIDSDGTVAIVGAGQTTISAEFAGNETYKASTVSYELNVITLGAIKANGSEATDLTVYANSEVVFSAENAESISYTVNGGDAVDASSWTPTEVGNYTVVVTATLTSTTNTQTFNVTVEEAPATQTVTTDFSAQGYTNGQAIDTVENPPVTFTFDKGTNSNAPKYYTSGYAIRVYGGNTVKVSVTDEYILTEVVITYGSGEGTNVITVDNGTFATDTWTADSETSEVTFTIDGTSGNRRFKEMEVTYALKGSETPDTREDVTLTFSETERSAVYGDTFTEPTLTVNPAEAASEVKYSSSNTEVATVDPTSGEVTIKAAGNTTITAAIKDSETYKDVEVSYALNVSVNVSSLTDFLAAKPTTTTVIPEPVTVYYQSPDKKYMFITDGTTNMMVYGTLSNTYQNGDVLTGIAGTYTEYGGMDELIPDASTFGEATEGTPIEPKAVTLAEEIAPCDFVILTGVDITEVNGNNATITDGTNSIDAYDRFGLSLAATENATIVAIGAVYNSNKQLYIVSVAETPDTREEVTLTFSETECSAVFGDAFIEPTLAVNPDTAAEEVKYSSSNTEVATVDPTSGQVTILAAGNTTITAAIKDSETYKDVEVSYTLTVIELGAIMFKDFVLDEGHMCGAFVGTPVTISAANAEAMSYTIDGGDLVEVEGSSFTWTPDAVGNYAFSVSASLAGQSKTVNFTVTVEEQPVGPEIEYPAYIRINQAPVNNNWAGRYLIVYEDGNVAFDGSLETLDVVNNNCNVTISEGYIKATDELANSEFTIAAIEGSENAWSVKSASNVYIGRSTDANELDESETELQNTISFKAEDGTVNIIGEGGAYLRYNSASNQNRFRYYKTSSYAGQKPIALYRYAANKDDDATAIEEVEAVGSEAAEAQWYDLNGRRVAAPGKGIYILKQGNKATKYAF